MTSPSTASATLAPAVSSATSAGKPRLSERVTIYDNADEAEVDARGRLAARDTCPTCCNTGRDLGAMSPVAPCPNGCGHPGAV
jgi:hypothetical protein